MSHTFSTIIGLYKYTIDIESLWELTRDFRKTPMPLSAFEHTLDWYSWGEEPIHPRNVLEQYIRIQEADLHYPIIIIRNQWGVVSHVVDGMHRIVKAFAKGHEKIQVIEITEVFLEKNYLKKESLFCDACGCNPCDCHWGDM